MAADGHKQEKSVDDALHARVGEVLNEFLDRKARGEHIREADLLAQHPDLATELRANLELLRDIEPSRHALIELLDRGILAKSTDPQYPAQLGPYQVEGLIGRGGMGIVLKAHEARLGRKVAVKVLRPELSGDKTALGRFELEARAAAALQHPNIVTVYAVGEERGTHYLAMEFIDGPTLATAVRESAPLPAPEVRSFFEQILAALGAAHDAGLVHRDVKSSNILLQGKDRRVKIADFGLARVMSTGTRMTLTGSVFGTPEYMSPEQARGEERVDHRSDLYSVGVVLYEMLTGRTPFKADSGSAVVHQILYEEPPDPRTLNRHADQRLCQFALRLMSKRPEDRFASAAETLAALEQGRQVYVPARLRRIRRVAMTVFAVPAVVVLLWLGWDSIMGALGERRGLIADTRRITRAFVDPKLATRIVVEREGSDEQMPFYSFPESAGTVKGVDWVELDGRGNVVVIAGTNEPVGRSCLFAFGGDATRLWEQDLSDAIRWPDCGPPTVWYTRALAKGNLDGKPGDEVVVVASDHGEYPNRVSLVSPRNGEIRKTFWHFGQLSGIQVVPSFFDGQRPAIIVWGINNKLQGFEAPQPGDRDHLATYRLVPAIMILDPQALGGLGPSRTQRLPDKVGQPPFAYAFLDVPYSNMATYWSADGGELVVPPPEQYMGIAKAEWGVYAPQEGAGPWFSLTVKGDNAPGAVVTVDRTLDFDHAVPNLSEKTGREEDFWHQRWRVVVREGKYVAD